MSTILKALRRLEEERNAQTARPLREQVATAPAEARTRRWPAYAVVLVAGVGLGAGVLLWSSRRPPGPPAAMDERAAAVAAAPSAPPSARHAAAAERPAMGERAASAKRPVPERAVAAERPAPGERAGPAKRPAIARRQGGAERPATARTPTPPTLRQAAAAAPPAPAAAVRPVVSPLDTAPPLDIAVVEPPGRESRLVDEPPVEPLPPGPPERGSEPVWRENARAAAQVARKPRIAGVLPSQAPLPDVLDAPPAAAAGSSLAAGEGSPASVAASAETPAFVAPEQEIAEPDAPAAPPAPVARAAPPAVVVARTIWHPIAERREAVLDVEGRGELRVREGDAVGPLVVETIEPSGVRFDHGGTTLHRRVGE